jgi:hypothetical protein
VIGCFHDDHIIYNSLFFTVAKWKARSALIQLYFKNRHVKTYGDTYKDITKSAPPVYGRKLTVIRTKISQNRLPQSMVENHTPSKICNKLCKMARASMLLSRNSALEFLRSINVHDSNSPRIQSYVALLEYDETMIDFVSIRSLSKAKDFAFYQPSWHSHG